jgi:hypothetical protein
MLRRAHLEGHITGVIVLPSSEIDGKLVYLPNLEHVEWFSSDQQVLGFLLSSLSKEVLPQVAA